MRFFDVLRKNMRFVVLSSLMMLSISACAVLPTATTEVGEVRYVAVPTAKINAPTTNKIATNSVATNQVITSQATTHQTTSQTTTSVLVPVVNAFVVKTDATGQETLLPVNVGTPVKAGDVLEYQALLTNHSPDRVRQAEVTLSIASGLELVGGISPEFAHASIDGSRFVRMPIRANVNGQIQVLPLSRYKALRWTVEELGIGATAVVKYRAKIK